MSGPTGDDLELLRAWRSDLSGPTPAALAEGRERLVAVAGKEARLADIERTRRLRGWLPAAAAVAVTVTVFATVGALTLSRESSPSISVQPRSALQMKMISVGVSRWLDRAADNVAAQSVTVPEPHQWMYEKTLTTEVVDGKLSFKPAEIWVRADGTKIKDSTTPLVFDSEGNQLTDEDGVMPAGLQGDDRAPLDYYQELLAWPDDPNALLDMASGTDKNSEEGRARAFAHLTGAIRAASILPPAQNAAIFRALALLPGVEMEEAQDADGRTGIAIGRQTPASSGRETGTEGHRYEIILDANTYQYLGDRVVALGEVPSGTAHDGPVLSASAVLARGIVSGPDERP
jgi:hypothetical protein